MNNAELWNLPDWQVPEQYPTIESYKGDPDPKKADQGSLDVSLLTPHLKISHGVWRWEFLRRLDEYRRIWGLKHNGKLSEEDEKTALGQFGLVELYGPRLTSYGCQLPKREIEDNSGDTQGQQSEGIDWQTFKETKKSAQSELMVKFIEENSFAVPEWTDLHEELIAIPNSRSAEELQLKASRNGSLIAAIDPLRPLSTQFAQITSEINQFKSEMDIGKDSRDSSKKYTLYLRLLDFKASEMKNKCLYDVAKEQCWPIALDSEKIISHTHIHSRIIAAKNFQSQITGNN